MLLNWVDYTIIGIILISAITSLVRGFVREILSLTVWVVAIGVSYYFHPHLAAHLDFIAVEEMRSLAAFTGLFLVTMLLGALISYLLGTLLEKAGISGTDRVVGALFGAVRGAAMVVILVLVAGMVPTNEQPWWQASTLLVYFVDAAIWVRQQLPADFASYFPHL